MLNPAFANVRNFNDFYHTLMDVIHGRFYVPRHVDFTNIIRVWKLIYCSRHFSGREVRVENELFGLTANNIGVNQDELEWILMVVGLKSPREYRNVFKIYEQNVLCINYAALDTTEISTWVTEDIPESLSYELASIARRDRPVYRTTTPYGYYYTQISNNAQQHRNQFAEIEIARQRLEESLSSFTIEVQTIESMINEPSEVFVFTEQNMDFDPFEGIPDRVFQTLKQAIE